MSVAEAESVRDWPLRLRKIADSLACPNCKSSVVCFPDRVACAECGRTYAVAGGKIYFIRPLVANDALDAIKARLKSLFGRNYYKVGVQIIAPTYPFNYGRAIGRHCDPQTNLVVDLGSGNNRISDHMIAVDAIDYDAVDIVADSAALPFKDESIDGFASRSVLEHLPDLGAAVSEVARCTKPGGLGIHLIPFLFPYHASPHDYQRLTHSGAAQLFRGWSLVEQRNATGPATLFVVCLAEFLAILLSFGVPRLKAAAYLAACVLLFPLKFLDAPFVGGKSFLSIAPSILTVVRKP